MVYDPVQERRDELRELEPRAPVPKVDPWELLRDALKAWGMTSSITRAGFALSDDWYAYDGMRRIYIEALKQHDAERKSDGTG